MSPPRAAFRAPRAPAVGALFRRRNDVAPAGGGGSIGGGGACVRAWFGAPHVVPGRAFITLFPSASRSVLSPQISGQSHCFGLGIVLTQDMGSSGGRGGPFARLRA